MEFNVEDYDEKRRQWMKRIRDGWEHRARGLHGRTGTGTSIAGDFGENMSGMASLYREREVDLNADVYVGDRDRVEVERKGEGEKLYEDEMRIMADVKAYFELSYKVSCTLYSSGLFLLLTEYISETCKQDSPNN